MERFLDAFRSLSTIFIVNRELRANKVTFIGVVVTKGGLMTEKYKILKKML